MGCVCMMSASPVARSAMETSLDAAELHLVHDLGEHAGLGFAVRDQHDGVVGTLDVQALDGAANLA